MKTFIQLAVGTAAMVLAAPCLYGTPFNHWMVFLPIFVGAMYATAHVQHWLHFRYSRRGAAAATPGAKARGAFRRS